MCWFSFQRARRRFTLIDYTISVQEPKFTAGCIVNKSFQSARQSTRVSKYSAIMSKERERERQKVNE